MSGLGKAAGTGFRAGALFQGILLGGFALVAAVLLAGGDTATRDAIVERRAEDLRASIAQVIPPESHENNLLADTIVLPGPDGRPLTVYQAIRTGKVAAVAFQVVGNGYAGPIHVIMGVTADGTLLGVRVLAHTETPGLGDKIEADRDDWILGFAGLGLGNPPPERWKVRKDGGRFDQFSGATITPRAVVAAVKGGLEFFAARRDVLLTLPAAEASERGTD